MQLRRTQDNPYDFEPSDERKAALVEAILLHGAGIYAYLIGKTGDARIAEDLAQDTWLKVYRYFSLDKFKDKGLLYRRALQTFLDHKRGEKIRRILGYHGDMSGISVAKPRAQEGQPSEAFAWEEFWSNFPGVEFDPIDQQCFWLIYRYDYTIKEVAERVGLPLSTVSDKVTRLIAKCRASLEKEEP